MAACARAATVSIFLFLTRVPLATPSTTPAPRLTENDCTVHTLPIEVLQQLMNSAEVILKNSDSGTAAQPGTGSSDAALDGSATHILLRRMDSELTELKRKLLSLEAGNSPTTSHQHEINSNVVNQVQQLQEETKQVKDQLSNQVQQLQEETKQVKDQLSNQVQQLQEETKQVKDQLSNQVQQLQEETKQVKDQLSNQVQQLQEETKAGEDQLSNRCSSFRKKPSRKISCKSGAAASGRNQRGEEPAAGSVSAKVSQGHPSNPSGYVRKRTGKTERPRYQAKDARLVDEDFGRRHLPVPDKLVVVSFDQRRQFGTSSGSLPVAWRYDVVLPMHSDVFSSPSSSSSSSSSLLVTPGREGGVSGVAMCCFDAALNARVAPAPRRFRRPVTGVALPNLVSWLP
ncbi:uncharacterized protein LOC135219234 [Macrobrachium nipponense]|uniref:uncharacterized protein LOC135219234 n=1 Tax=Macrobrachium nipponense TaxID=159736 RepID=UPI0030C84FCC